MVTSSPTRQSWKLACLASGSPNRNLIGFHHQHGNGNDNGPMLGYKLSTKYTATCSATIVNLASSCEETTCEWELRPITVDLP